MICIDEQQFIAVSIRPVLISLNSSTTNVYAFARFYEFPVSAWIGLLESGLQHSLVVS
jgi:hypothetical protein